MKDRISGKPGRVLITPENGAAPYYAVMTRADEPEQEGTPLNKATLLTDETAALFGLGADAVPNEALVKLHQATPQVGDTLGTVRTNLGNKWLLCNGDAIYRSEYEKLADVMGVTETNKVISSDSSRLQSITYYNGTWVAVGSMTYESYSYPYICATNDLTGAWTTQRMPNNGYLWGVACYNGTWVAVGTDYSKYPVIYTTTDPAGAWTKKQLSTSTKIELKGVDCYNGTWVAVGYYDASVDRPYFYTTTDPAGEWTSVYDSGSTGVSVYGVACYNGTWVAAGNTYNKIPYIYISTNPAETWDLYQLSTTTAEIHSIACYDGEWVVVGDLYADGNYYPYIFTTTDPAGVWTEQAISDTKIHLQDIACFDGTWMATGYTDGIYTYPYIFTATDPSGTWTEKRLGTGQMIAYGVTYDNDIWVVAGHYTGSRSPQFFTNGIFYLPTISVEGIYTYIKVKE